MNKISRYIVSLLLSIGFYPAYALYGAHYDFNRLEDFKQQLSQSDDIDGLNQLNRALENADVFDIEFLKSYVRDNRNGIREQGQSLNITDVKTSNELLARVKDNLGDEKYNKLYAYINWIKNHKENYYYPPYGYKHGVLDYYLLQQLGLNDNGDVNEIRSWHPSKMQQMSQRGFEVIKKMIKTGFLKLDWSEFKAAYNIDKVDYTYDVSTRMRNMLNGKSIQNIVLGCGHYIRANHDTDLYIKETYCPKNNITPFGCCGLCKSQHMDLDSKENGTLTVSLDPLDEPDILADVLKDEFWSTIPKQSIDSVIDETWIGGSNFEVLATKIYEALRPNGRYMNSQLSEDQKKFLIEIGFTQIHNETNDSQSLFVFLKSPKE